MYAMCIVRAVNGLVESSQQGYFAASVMTLANRIGLPSWFVDLRHDSTHSALPSINLLRSASRSLLLWCRETYWDQQHIYLENLSYRCLNFNSDESQNTGNYSAKEILENSNGFDVLFAHESTFLSNILLPLFHDHLRNSLHDHPAAAALHESPSPILSLETSFSPKASKEKEMWEMLLLKAISCQRGAIHLIMSSLFSTFLNAILSNRKGSTLQQEGPPEAVGPPAAMWEAEIQSLYYLILNQWSEEISERYLTTIQSEGNRNEMIPLSPPVSILGDWQRYQNLSDHEKKVLEPIKNSLEKLYGLSGLNSLDEKGVLVEEDVLTLSAETVPKKNRNKRKSPEPFHLVVGGGRENPQRPLRRKRMWPLGNQIGDLSSCYLHLLEEIS
jgi:hypothetical protein